jgi:hypothetical protein
MKIAPHYHQPLDSTILLLSSSLWQQISVCAACLGSHSKTRHSLTHFMPHIPHRLGCIENDGHLQSG